MSIVYEWCGQTTEVEMMPRGRVRMVCAGLLWMTFPIILIYLTLIGRIGVASAIALVTTFHFVAMYYLIRRMKYRA